MKYARVLPDRFLPAITGNPGKGLVDVDDGARSIGYHDAFAGVGKNPGRQLQLDIGLLALGDIAGHPDQSQGFPVFIPKRYF